MEVVPLRFTPQVQNMDRESEMKLWLIVQAANTGYDTYDSAVVAAETEEAACNTHPSEYPDTGWPEKIDLYSTWALPSKVTARLIGSAVPGTKAGVICASFNAG